MGKTYRIIRLDPALKRYKSDIDTRMFLLADTCNRLGIHQSVSDFANGHLYFGFHQAGDSWVYREWAPAADSIVLTGDFCHWDLHKHEMTRSDNGNWEVHVKGELPHASRVRVIITKGGHTFERLPLYVRRVVQNSDTYSFDGVIWNPAPYQWAYDHVKRNKKLFIYECHIGMSGEQECVSGFIDFTDNVLPYIHHLGYTAIQIMAIMEHPYYGSFGYQVSNFFAVSSRFGTPEDFKRLVDEAHRLGLSVIMDLVHSHMVRNTVEGPSQFDGTDYQFCHTGPKGDHSAWNTRLFDYGKPEVIHFLLSNIKYWLEEYHLDGFRFDGVTSMLYVHHGLGVSFDHYQKYFQSETDNRAIVYLQLAALLAKEVRPSCVLIAEDMSGMPGMCLPVTDGGIGFDYRLNMGLPDYLVRLTQINDYDWNLGALWYELTTRRPAEKAIGYTESHDQALVGDKTLIFRMADKEMYDHMRRDDPSPTIERALSLIKLLRFITCAVGGDGYLNFMGNEFGHPEWIDFPREGNGWSYHYCRRQWHLVRDLDLKYSWLAAFDKSMIAFLKARSTGTKSLRLLFIDHEKKAIVFQKGSEIYLFNFHPQGKYVLSLDPRYNHKVVFHTALEAYGGNVRHDLLQSTLNDHQAEAERRSAVVIKRLIRK